jgi:hypothetical protein
MYIHQNKNYKFTWDADVITPLLGEVRHQGIILGVMQALVFDCKRKPCLKP